MEAGWEELRMSSGRLVRKSLLWSRKRWLLNESSSCRSGEELGLRDILRSIQQDLMRLDVEDEGK